MSDLYVFFDDSNQIIAVSGNKGAITSARYAIFCLLYTSDAADE